MWRGLSCVKVAGRRRKSPQKKKKRAQRPTDHRMHLNWFIKAPTVHPACPPPPPRAPLSLPDRLRPPPLPFHAPALFAIQCVPRFSRAVHQPPWYDPMESRNTPRRAGVPALVACRPRVHRPIARTRTRGADAAGDILLIAPTPERKTPRLRRAPESAARVSDPPSPANYGPSSSRGQNCGNLILIGITSCWTSTTARARLGTVNRNVLHLRAVNE